MRLATPLVIVSLLLGCSGQGVAQNGAKPAVSLQIKGYDEVAAAVAAHKGKVVVLDAWSTSCDPCIKEFPHLVELHKKHGADKIACISLSCDFEGLGKPEEQLPKVLKFLTEQGATFQNFLGREDSDTLFGKLKIPSIPAVFIYAKDGTLAKKIDAEFSYTKDVNPLVDELLKK